eukprot:XP_013966333.1 uncharacterized protein LOC102155927 isoform X2 [Canis lupus familiaris]
MGGSAAKERLPRARLASLPGSLFPRTTHRALEGTRPQSPLRGSPWGPPGKQGTGRCDPGRQAACRCPSRPLPGRVAWASAQVEVSGHLHSGRPPLGLRTAGAPHTTPRSSASQGVRPPPGHQPWREEEKTRGQKKCFPQRGHCCESAGFKSAASLKQIP